MRNDSAMDRIKGKAKEMFGKATGDRKKTAEGQTDQTKGRAKDTMDDMKGRAEGMKDSISKERPQQDPKNRPPES